MKRIEWYKPEKFVYDTEPSYIELCPDPYANNEEKHIEGSVYILAGHWNDCRIFIRAEFDIFADEHSSQIIPFPEGVSFFQVYYPEKDYWLTQNFEEEFLTPFPELEREWKKLWQNPETEKELDSMLKSIQTYFDKEQNKIINAVMSNASHLCTKEADECLEWLKSNEHKDLEQDEVER